MAVGCPVQDLKQQVEFCFSDTYIALNKVLRSNITKGSPKAMSVSLSSVASVFPTPEAIAPDTLLVRAAMEGLQNVEVNGEDAVTYVGRSAPNGSRVRECRRKSVVVDRIPVDSTAETIRELLAGCGRIVSVGICHPRLAASYVKGAFRSKALHAIVQFATVQDAVRAVETTNFSWRGGPRVTHLMIDFRAPSPLKAQNQNVSREAATSTDNSSTDGEDLVGSCKSGCLDSESSGEFAVPPNILKKPKKNKSRKSLGKNESDNSNKLQGSKKPDTAASRRSNKKDYAAWAAATPENRAQPRFGNSSTAPGAPVIDGIRPRLPRGPDGTRGFTMGRGRPLPLPA